MPTQPNNKNRNNRPFPHGYAEDCVEAYSHGLSIYAVQKLFGVHYSNVFRWVNTLSEMRSKEEASAIESINLRGVSRSPETQFKRGHKTWNKGTHPEYVQGENHPNYGKEAFWIKGERNPNWKGGVTNNNERARKVFLYMIWRTSVMYKDEWTCQDCGKRGGRLTAHHIVPFSKNEMLRYSLLNGVTLCEPCHANRHPDLNYKSLVGVTKCNVN